MTVVADAYYAAAKFYRRLLAQGRHLISRVCCNGVAHFPASSPKVPRRGRPATRKDFKSKVSGSLFMGHLPFQQRVVAAQLQRHLPPADVGVQVQVTPQIRRAPSARSARPSLFADQGAEGLLAQFGRQFEQVQIFDLTGPQTVIMDQTILRRTERRIGKKTSLDARNG